VTRNPSDRDLLADSLAKSQMHRKNARARQRATSLAPNVVKSTIEFEIKNANYLAKDSPRAEEGSEASPLSASAN
jgi:hypothetical protein